MKNTYGPRTAADLMDDCLEDNGILSPDHPFNLHTVGQPKDEITSEAFDRADLVVAIGFDPVEYSPENITLDGARRSAHLGAAS